jgi:hypothetical protein
MTFRIAPLEYQRAIAARQRCQISSPSFGVVTDLIIIITSALAAQCTIIGLLLVNRVAATAQAVVEGKRGG